MANKNTRSSIIRFIVENTLTQELYTDNAIAKQVLEDELSVLNFGTTVSEIKTENNITFLQVSYKKIVDGIESVSVLDVSVVANPTMIIKKLESRTKWLCEAEGHSYVRQEIKWTNGGITITWHLNEDSTADYEPLTDEQLETIFWQNNGKKNNPVFYSSNTDKTFTPTEKGWYIQYRTESGDEDAIKVDREPTSDEDALQMLQEIDADELWDVKFYALVD